MKPRPLSRLVDAAASGETIIITRAGTPLVKVTAIDEPKRPKQRLGFYEGSYNVPDDFDTMFAEEIADLFEGKGRE